MAEPEGAKLEGSAAPDKLRDPIWEYRGWKINVIALVVTVILGVGGMAIGYWQWASGRTEKSLSYGIVSQGPLVDVKDEAKGRLQVLLDGKPVTNVTLFVIRVTNSGTVSIKPDDFVKPLQFSFAPANRILSAELVRQIPATLGASLKRDEKNVTLTPLLLNQQDSLTFKVLISGAAEKAVVGGRIVDVREITEIQGRDKAEVSINQILVRTFGPIILPLYFFILGSHLGILRAHRLLKVSLDASMEVKHSLLDAKRNLFALSDRIFYRWFIPASCLYLMWFIAWLIDLLRSW